MLAGFVIAAGTALSLGRRHFGHALVALILTAVPFGGYWYMRNYWLTRVPLYPQGADAIGIGYPNLWETTLVGNPDSQRIALAARALWIMTGPYHVFAVAAVPIAAVSLAWRGICRFRRGARAEAAVSLGFSVLLIGSAAIFAITPFCVEDQPGTLNHLRWAYTPARYGLCFLSVVAIATAWLAKQGVDQLTLWLARWLGAPSVMHPAVPLAFQGLFAAGVAWQLYLRLSYLSAHPDLRYAPDLLGEALLALSLCGTGWLTLEWARGTSWSRGKVTAIAAAAVFGGASAGAAGLSIHWHNEYGRHFDALRGTTVFSFLSRGPGKTIAVFDLRPYPFFGSARQHRVCSPRILTAYDELVAYLETRHPDFVASPPRKTGDFFNRYEPGPEWLRMHESVFKPIVRGGAFNLYSFNRPRRGKAALGHTQSNFGDGSHYK